MSFMQNQAKVAEQPAKLEKKQSSVKPAEAPAKEGVPAAEALQMPKKRASAVKKDVAAE